MKHKLKHNSFGLIQQNMKWLRKTKSTKIRGANFELEFFQMTSTFDVIYVKRVMAAQGKF